MNETEKKIAELGSVCPDGEACRDPICVANRAAIIAKLVAVATTNMIDYRTDIPTDVAMNANRGTSFYPETRAEQERTDYHYTLTRDLENLGKLADTPEKKALLVAEFARYREGLKAKTLAYLHAKSRCVSTMIAGPANFPVNSQRKRSDSADNRSRELSDFRQRALDAIRKTLQPELRPIMSGDVDAVARLKEKLAAAETEQAKMKAANAAIRKAKKGGAAAQVAALVALAYTEILARQIVAPDSFGNVGFPSYEIVNGGANIRRMKERLAHLERVKAEAPRTVQSGDVRVEYAPAENRIRLYFPGKPSEEVRSRLKRGGFRWAPSLGAWSSYFSPTGKAIAESFAAEAAQPVPEVAA